MTSDTRRKKTDKSVLFDFTKESGGGRLPKGKSSAEVAIVNVPIANHNTSECFAAEPTEVCVHEEAANAPVKQTLYADFTEGCLWWNLGFYADRCNSYCPSVRTCCKKPKSPFLLRLGLRPRFDTRN